MTEDKGKNAVNRITGKKEDHITEEIKQGKLSKIQDLGL